eukprot:jgi/Tetstr1/465335/TSEL_010021.t1
MIDFACVSSSTPTWGNGPRWGTPGVAATDAEHNNLAADWAFSAPVLGVHRKSVVDHLPICPVWNYKHRMHTALKNMWPSVAIEAGAVLDQNRSGVVGDLTLEASELRPADRSRPPD